MLERQGEIKAGGSADEISGGIHRSVAHESASKHVTGSAIYTDDIAEPYGTLHAALGLSERAHAVITALDLSAVRSAAGVIAVLGVDDIPGVNDISPTGRHDEPVFPDGLVEYHGQPLFAVIAETRAEARRAARLARVSYDELAPLLDIASARAAGGALVTPPLTLQRGELAMAMASAPHTITGQMVIGGQDHFYLEGQISLAVPGEDDNMLVYCSTQHPSEVQHMVAHVLGVPQHAVKVELRRMGGGFGGKETQSNIVAAIAAMAARQLRRPVKLRLDRDEDMVATGKRHDFLIDYDVGFDGDGRIAAVDMRYAARCGFSADLSGPVTDRSLFHADNCYYYPAVRLVSEPLKTNMVSATAFRGFGGPQGMVGAERVIEEIAFALGKDPLDIRKLNFYDEAGATGQSEIASANGPARNITPYHQCVEDNIIQFLVGELERRADYASRRAAIAQANAHSPIIKRGLALTPVKFGISFTATHFNQAGALVHVYTDGSVQLNHGGTEMGQGLNTKVAQIVAEEFQIDLGRVKITATATDKVPNTSATAASSGSDLNGMAARNAARTIKQRLIEFAAGKYGVSETDVSFAANRLRAGAEEISFAELAQAAYAARVQLSATGFYTTPKIHWDRTSGQGRPFYYFSYGASLSEVAVDTLTGEYRVERVDILHDVGNSLNPAIDIGQIEGGFIQGMGWLTTEELFWDGAGRLRTHAPSTYKIPLASDRPRIFNCWLADWSENREETIYRSKAVGEPPLMLAISVLHALSDAVASVAGHRFCPRLDTPATPERVLAALDRLRGEAARADGITAGGAP